MLGMHWLDADYSRLTKMVKLNFYGTTYGSGVPLNDTNVTLATNGLRQQCPETPEDYLFVDLAASRARAAVTSNTIVAAAPAGRALVDVVVLPLRGDHVLARVGPDAVAADSQLLSTAVALAAVVAAGPLVEERGGGRDVALLDEGEHDGVGSLGLGLGEGDGLSADGEEEDGYNGGEAHGGGFLTWKGLLEKSLDGDLMLGLHEGVLVFSKACWW